MDRKEKKSGDPFGGAPMKRLEPTQMPTPPDISELVKEETKPVEKEDRSQCPPKYRDLRCPCGMTYENCVGSIFLDRDTMFAAIAQSEGR